MGTTRDITTAGILQQASDGALDIDIARCGKKRFSVVLLDSRIIKLICSSACCPMPGSVDLYIPRIRVADLAGRSVIDLQAAVADGHDGFSFLMKC